MGESDALTGQSVWEVERDRHGVMFSGPLEVGECRRVVDAAQCDRYREALERILATSTSSASSVHIARAALASHPDRASTPATPPGGDHGASKQKDCRA